MSPAGNGFPATRIRLPVFTSLHGYPAGWLRDDVVAGLTVWAVLVPEALADFRRTWETGVYAWCSPGRSGRSATWSAR